MLDVILDTLIDSVKLIPFLLLTYLILEFIEHKTKNGSSILMKQSGRWGPIIGSALGLVPQCGFSASASNLYAQNLISTGTLLAVFISTSDEMLPVLISESVGIPFILKVLSVKLLAGMLIGFAVDIIFKINKKNYIKSDIHKMCEHDHCGCEKDGIFLSAVRHTVQIIIFIVLVSFLLNTVIYFVGEDMLRRIILNKPVLGSFISALVGLIPNCASSIIITELYLSGAMSAGAMISGLISASGIGLLVLFRVNRHNTKHNLFILTSLYFFGVVIGIFCDLIGLAF